MDGQHTYPRRSPWHLVRAYFDDKVKTCFKLLFSDSKIAREIARGIAHWVDVCVLSHALF